MSASRRHRRTDRRPGRGDDAPDEDFDDGAADARPGVDVGRVLAVDYGDRRTGMAATDFTGRIRVPLERIDHGGAEDCARAVAAVRRERGSDVVVVGMPLDSRGEIGHRAQRTLPFVAALRALVEPEGGVVTTIDETGTTDEAHARLGAAGMKAARRKRLADSVAALVILERYLASRGAL